MKGNIRDYLNLLFRYLLLLDVIPNLVFAVVLSACHSDYFEPFVMLAVVLFIPMTLYYILPALIAGGYGFVGQMGVGPDSLAGFVIAITFWFAISILLAKLHLTLKINGGVKHD